MPSLIITVVREDRDVFRVHCNSWGVGVDFPTLEGAADVADAIAKAALGRYEVKVMPLGVRA